jgi:hypothetical protein
MSVAILERPSPLRIAHPLLGLAGSRFRQGIGAQGRQRV